MRIFLAIPASDSLKKQISAWRKPFFNWPVRWTLAKNLHITLVPPWEESNVDILIKRLGGFRGLGKPFTLNFLSIQFGPNPKQPRLIWLKGESAPQAGGLKDSLKQLLQVQTEKRAFQPHVTLARFRPEDFASLPVKNLNTDVDWRQTVNLLALYESALSAQGADYRILKTISLNLPEND